MINMSTNENPLGYVIVGVCNPMVEEAVRYDPNNPTLNPYGMKPFKTFEDVFYVYVGKTIKHRKIPLNVDNNHIVIDHYAFKKYTIVRIQWISYEVIFDADHNARVEPVEDGGYFQYTVQDPSGRIEDMKENDIKEKYSETKNELEEIQENTITHIGKLKQTIEWSSEEMNNAQNSFPNKEEYIDKRRKTIEDARQRINMWEKDLDKCRKILTELTHNTDDMHTSVGGNSNPYICMM